MLNPKHALRSCVSEKEPQDTLETHKLDTPSALRKTSNIPGHSCLPYEGEKMLTTARRDSVRVLLPQKTHGTSEGFSWRRDLSETAEYL